MPGLTATQSAEGKLTGLARLQVKAKQDRSLRFSNLLHHITPEMMEKAYKSLNRQSARGVDHRSKDVYAQGSWLKSVVQGHNNYYAASGNLKALKHFVMKYAEVG
jgi:hypothetical protein